LAVPELLSLGGARRLSRPLAARGEIRFLVESVGGIRAGHAGSAID
jgi:hypothetical protein